MKNSYGIKKLYGKGMGVEEEFVNCGSTSAILSQLFSLGSQTQNF